MKDVQFLGSSLGDLRAFPKAARQDMGRQINRVQQGLDPKDWKPMPRVGRGVREIRIRDEGNAYRTMYVTNIADSPEEAASLKMRSQLMDVIEAYIEREKITQAEAAKRLGVPRSRVSELVNGNISKFSIDKLVKMATRVGLTTKLTIKRERKRKAA